MAFLNKKEKKKIYDCKNDEEYIAYKAILTHEYLCWFKSNPSEDDLKRKLFTINTLIERRDRFDLSLSLTISIALITMLIDDKFMELLSPLYSNFIFTIKVFLVLGGIYFAIKSWGYDYREQNKETSMFKLEKQVLEELITEKSKPHKSKAKVRRK